MSQVITEASSTLKAEAVEGKPGRLLIGIISPGQGSSGFYSSEVLEAAATAKVFPKGTHMYLNHPTESEKFERAERDVRDIAAVFESDARWDGAQLVAEASIVGPYRELLTDPTFASAIGVSIRASAEVDETAEGRVITRIVEGKSADFVTHAGRGGSILDVLESARPANVNDRAMHRGVTEATVNDKREALSTVVRDTYAADKTYVWLRDFDDSTAWFDIESGDDNGTWQQAYTTGENDLATSLTGERIEVRPVTTYVPVAPAGQSTTEESEEDTMATTQIEESALAELREKAGRAETAESERDAAIQERDEALAKIAPLEEAARSARLGEIIAEADVEFDDLQVEGLKAKAVVKEGVLDEDAFKTVVTEAAAKVAEAQGAGRVRGNGTRVTTTDDEVSEADLDELDDATFGVVKEG
jgi:hypothetical protein